MAENLHWDSLPANTRHALEALSTLPGLADFYLAGGTALALQIGHRLSQDLDFFSTNDRLDFGARATLAEQLQLCEPVIIHREVDGMVYATVKGVEVSFIYQLPQKYPDRPDFEFHLAHGLRYFEDAENDPRELAMRRAVRWPDVKRYCEAGARLLTKRSTGLTPRGL
jgi:hypothetical protein